MSAHYAMCKYDDATGSYIPLPDGMATGFEKWFASYAPYAPESLDDCAFDAYQAGAASRDAEIDQLRAELEYDQRNAAMSQSESARLLDENTKLRAELEAVRAEIERLNSIYDEISSACVWVTFDGLPTLKDRLIASFDGFEKQRELDKHRLAAEQAKNVGLRKLVEYSTEYRLGDPVYEQALATKSDTSALEAIVKKAGEVMRERCVATCNQEATDAFDYGEANEWARGVVMCSELISLLPGVTLDDLKG